MGESLTQRHRVEDEVFRDVNSCQGGRWRFGGNAETLTVLPKEAPANYVPAAAVIRRGQTLSGFTGRKGCVGGLVGRW